VEADAKQAAKEAEERAIMATQERDALTATVRELTATIEMSQVSIFASGPQRGTHIKGHLQPEQYGMAIART
jgi:hypothetical protein